MHGSSLGPTNSPPGRDRNRSTADGCATSDPFSQCFRQTCAGWQSVLVEVLRDVEATSGAQADVYLVDPLAPTYRLVAAHPARSPWEVDSSFVDAVGPVARPSESVVVIDAANDALLSTVVDVDRLPRHHVVFALEAPDAATRGLLHVAWNGEPASEDALTRARLRVQAMTPGLLQLTAALQLQAHELEIAIASDPDSDSILDALVPDASSVGAAPRLAAASILEGTSPWISGVQFNCVRTAVSPRFMRQIADREALFSALRKPGCQLGFETASRARAFATNVLARAGALSLVQFADEACEGDPDSEDPSLEALDRELRRMRAADRSSLRVWLRTQYRIHELAERALEEPAAALAREGRTGILWLVERRPAPVVADWGDGDGFAAAFRLALEGDEASEGAGSWADGILAELADRSHGPIWARFLCALVEWSSGSAGEHSISSAADVRTPGAFDAPTGFHGPVADSRTAIDLSWEDGRCDLAFRHLRWALRSSWETRSVVFPLAVRVIAATATKRDTPVKLSCLPPAAIREAVVRPEPRDLVERPRPESWSVQVARVVSEAFGGDASPWPQDSALALAVPLPDFGNEGRPQMDRWCASADGRRLLLGLQPSSPFARPPSPALREVLGAAQERVRRAHASRPLLLEHVEHDLTAVRRQLDEVDEALRLLDSPAEPALAATWSLSGSIESVSDLLSLFSAGPHPARIDLATLLGSIHSQGLRGGVDRALRRLRLGRSRKVELEAIVACSVPYAPHFDPVAEVLLRNVLANALVAAWRWKASPLAPSQEPLVVVAVGAGSLLVSNRCRPQDLEDARNALRDSVGDGDGPLRFGRGLSVIVLAARLLGARVSLDADGPERAVLEIIPRRR